MTESKLGQKGLIWFPLPHYSLSLREARTGAQTRLELGGRSRYKNHRRVLHTGFLPHSLLSPIGFSHIPYSVYFNIEPRTRTTIGWALLHWSLTKQMPTSGFYGGPPFFFSWGSLFFDDPSLCHINMKLASPNVNCSLSDTLAWQPEKTVSPGVSFYYYREIIGL